MTDFDKIRNLIINAEMNRDKTCYELLNDICNICFARDIKIDDCEVRKDV